LDALSTQHQEALSEAQEQHGAATEALRSGAAERLKQQQEHAESLAAAASLQSQRLLEMQSKVEALSSENETNRAEHMAAVERLCAEHELLMADTDARHAAAVCAHRAEQEAMRAQARQDVDELNVSLGSVSYY
jgi:hypothetical protein